MMLYYILLPFAWLLWHLGFRIRVEGRENLKKVQTKGYILAPTHVSAIDPVFIAVTRWGGRMVIFAKKELFEINAFLSWFFRCCGGVCVRGTKDEVAVIAQTVEACKNGRTLLIFPEGRFSTTGEILEFRSTAALLALQTDVPIIPMWHSVNYGFGKRTDVVIGEPIRLSELCSTANPDAAELDRLTAILRDKVIELRGMAQEA